jgi:hypothetical protein
MPVTDQKKRTVQARLCADPVVKRCLESSQREQAKFHAEYDQHINQLDPVAAKRALQGELNKATNADSISALQLAISSYENPRAKSHLDAHDRSASVICKAVAPLTEANLALIHAALAAMQEIEAEAIADEAALHESYGLKRQETAVYRRLQECKRKLHDFGEAVNAPIPCRPMIAGHRWHPFRSHQGFVMDWFCEVSR